MSTYSPPLSFEDSEFYKFDSQEYRSVAERTITKAYACIWSGEEMLLAYNAIRQKWVLPGGTRERDESVYGALVREVKEETGYTVNISTPIGILKAHSRKGVFYARIYDVRVVRKDGMWHGDPDGTITENMWVTKHTYKQYMDWGSVSEYLCNR